MDYLKIAKDIISIDNSVPPGSNYEKTVDYLVPVFNSVNFTAEKIAIPEQYAENRSDRFALVAHRRKAGKPRLIFYAHIDVVPAEGWDAFVPKVENGKIFGRGAADMKGGLVGMLLGLDEIKNKDLRYDISCIVTTDEEDSQADQLRYLSKFIEPVKGAAIFSLDSSAGFVSVANLGLLQIDVIVNGKSVHSAMAHHGTNAVEKAIPLLYELLRLKNRVVKRKSKVKTNPDTGLSVMESRLNINMVKGGIKANIIPESCLISIDRRLIPEENLEDAERELMATLRSVPDVYWEIERTFKIPSVPPSKGTEVDRLEKIIQEVTGSSGQYGEMGSGDLSAIVANEWQATDFGLGVIRPDNNIHGKDEFAYLKDIEDLGKIVARFLTEK
jgi:succinyl-diaminopimelate desuccinylase